LGHIHLAEHKKIITFRFKADLAVQ